MLRCRLWATLLGIASTAAMKRRRVHVNALEASSIELPSASAHYLRDVLRLTVGDVLELFDGRGNAASATLSRVDAQGVTVVVDERYSGSSSIPVTIAMATPKGDRADLAVEKLTELGVSRIVWLICARSVVVPREDGKRLQRWARIAEAAAAQSGRNDVPEIVAPIDFTAALTALGGGMLAHPDGPSIVETLQGDTPLTCLIGPEGGFTDDELGRAQRAGYSRVALTRTVLRTETAAIVAAAAMEIDRG